MVGGWVGGWMDGWMGGWMDGWVGSCWLTGCMVVHGGPGCMMVWGLRTTERTWFWRDGAVACGAMVSRMRVIAIPLTD